MDLLSRLNPEWRVWGELFIDRPRRYHDPWARAHGHLVPNPRYYDWRLKTGMPRPKAPITFLRRLERKAQHKDAFGFKLMDNQLCAMPELLTELVARRYRFIHLYRVNHLETLVSLKLLRETGLAHTNNRNAVPATTSLSSDEFKGGIDMLQSRHSRRKRLLKLLPNPVMELTYEDLVRNGDVQLRRVADFLETQPPAEHMASVLRRVNPGSIHDKLQNYEELSSLFANTRYGRYFEVRQ